MGSWHVFLLWLEVQCGYLACLPTLARGAVWVAGMSPYSGLQSCRPVTTWDFPFCYEGRVDEGHGPGGIEAQMRLVRNLSCLPPKSWFVLLWAKMEQSFLLGHMLT